MEKYLLGLARQILDAVAIGRHFSLPSSYRRVSKILFCGMGGSAVSGVILRVLVSRKAPFPFAVYRAGRTPEWMDSDTLAIFSSYSGNTQEVIKVFKEARRARAKILILTSGGYLGKVAAQKKIPCLRIPKGLPPRCAIGYLTFSLIPILKKFGWVNVSERDLQEVLSIVRGTSREEARKLARRLLGRFPHLYGMSGLVEAALVRWRAQFAENAKTLASHHVIPEMFHNEIEGWKFPRDVIRKSAALFFVDREDPSWVHQKRRFAQKLIQARGGRVIEIQSHGKAPLARLFSLICLGDWVSYELARLNGVDPLGIPTIEAVKKITGA